MFKQPLLLYVTPLNIVGCTGINAKIFHRCNEYQIHVIFKFLKSYYGTAVSLTQLSSNSHHITANSAHCKYLLYITRCPNFAMRHCFVLYFQECLTRQPFFNITRHFDNNETHSDAPSSYVPEFIKDITTEKVTERLAILCNVSGVCTLPFDTG